MKEECVLFSYVIYQFYHLVDAVACLALPAVQNHAPFWPCSIREEMCTQVTQHSKVLYWEKKELLLLVRGSGVWFPATAAASVQYKKTTREKDQQQFVQLSQLKIWLTGNQITDYLEVVWS